MAPDDAPDLDPKLNELVRKAVEEVRGEFLRKLEETRDRLERLVRGDEVEEEPGEAGSDGEASAAEDSAAAVPSAPVPSSADLLASIAAIDRSRSQTEILAALLAAARGADGRAALFLTRTEGLEGWAADGFGDADEAFAEHSVEYGEETPWAHLAEGKGSVELDAAHCAALCAGLDVPAADGGMLVPLVLRDSLAAALYVDRTESSVVVEPAQLQIVTYVAAQALETLPLRTRATTATLLWSDEADEDEPGLPLWESAAVATAVAIPEFQVEDDQVEETPVEETLIDEAQAEEAEAVPEPEEVTEDVAPVEDSWDEPPSAVEDLEASLDDEQAPGEEAEGEAVEDPQEEPVPFVEAEDLDEAPETATEEETPEEPVDEGIEVDAAAPMPWNLVETPGDETVEEASEESDTGQDAPEWVEPESDDSVSVPKPEEAAAGEPEPDTVPAVSVPADTVPFEETPEEVSVEAVEEGAPLEEAAPAEEEATPEKAPEEEASEAEETAEAVPEDEAPAEELPEPETEPTAVSGFTFESIPAPELEGPDPYEDESEEQSSQDSGYPSEPSPWPIAGETIPVGDSLYGDDEPEAETPDVEADAADEPAAEERQEDEPEDTPEPETDGGEEPEDIPIEPPQDELAALSPDEPAEVSVPDTATDTTQPVDVPVTGTPGSGTQVTPPEDVEGPGWAFSAAGSMSDGSIEARQEEARRLARLLVTEIKLYNEEQVAEGRAQGSIYRQLKDDIDRSRVIFEERVDDDIRQERDFFREELVRILAGGDESILGD